MAEQSTAEDHEARLSRLARRTEASREVHEDDRKARDRAIREAIDDGCSVGSVARWALMSRARVTQILGQGED